MSAQMKRRGIKAVITLAVTVFVFLMFFNIAFAPSTSAKDVECGTVCFWDGNFPGCTNGGSNCLGCWSGQNLPIC